MHQRAKWQAFFKDPAIFSTGSVRMKVSKTEIHYLASVMDLNRVSVGIGEISMGSRPPVLASREQPATELTDRCYNAFVLFQVWQHVSEMAHAALYTWQIFLALSRILYCASPRKPGRDAIARI